MSFLPAQPPRYYVMDVRYVCVCEGELTYVNRDIQICEYVQDIHTIYFIYGGCVVLVSSETAALPQPALDPVGETHVLHEIVVMDAHIPLGVLIKILISSELNY